jgi:hypothetical protein
MATDALPLGLDPLIAEAKERARRRRLLALGAVVVVAAAAVGTTLGTRSASGNSLGMCATVPSGWLEKTVNEPSLNPPAVVLTNFKFGRMDDFYGLTDRFDWPANGVTVAVSNVAASPARLDGGVLRVSAKDFGGLEGAPHPSGQIVVRSNGRILNGYVEVGTITPATIAAANQALAGVRTCSA